MEGGENAARQEGCCEVDDAGGSRSVDEADAWNAEAGRQGVRAPEQLVG